MTEPGFPQVIVHEGPVDAGPHVIIVNTRDAQISRGHFVVRYGGVHGMKTHSFRMAKLALTSAPRVFNAHDAVTAVYGTDRSTWPKDLNKALRQPLRDVRHRLCPRLGLRLERFGLHGYRLSDEGFECATNNEPRRVQRSPARGSARKDLIGVRSFTVTIGDADADEVRAFALAKKISFQEALRTLMQWGLEAANQEEPAS